MQGQQDEIQMENENLKQILEEKDQVQAQQVGNFEMREKILNDELNKLKIQQERQISYLQEENQAFKDQVQILQQH